MPRPTKRRSASPGNRAGAASAAAGDGSGRAERSARSPGSRSPRGSVSAGSGSGGGGGGDGRSEGGRGAVGGAVALLEAMQASAWDGPVDYEAVVAACGGTVSAAEAEALHLAVLERSGVEVERRAKVRTRTSLKATKRALEHAVQKPVSDLVATPDSEHDDEDAAKSKAAKRLRTVRQSVTSKHIAPKAKRSKANRVRPANAVAAPREFEPVWEALLSAVRTQLSEAHLPTARDASGSPSLPGIDSQAAELRHLLGRVLFNRENHSALLVGHRGCGKSLALRRVLHDLRCEQHGDVASERPAFVAVYLDGGFIKDDNTALREISRQLALDPEIHERAAAIDSEGADQDGGGVSSTVDRAPTRSLPFEAHLSFVMDALRAGKAGSVPIVIILDEFDSFAARSKQTLLYNLFDMTQSSEVQIGVVGLTCRLDVVEMLEKRLRSRFSHRQILFLPPSEEALKEIALQGLTVGADHLDAEHLKIWNEHVQALLKSKSVAQLFRRFYKVGWSPRLLRRWLNLSIAQVATGADGQPELSVTTMEKAAEHLSAVGPLEGLIGDLSLLEQILLIAIIILERADATASYNFEIVYAEYDKFVRSGRARDQGFEKEVALKAFEHLVTLGLIKWASTDSTSTKGSAQMTRQFLPVRLTLDADDLADGIKANKFSKFPIRLRQWVRDS